jgi:hypothetical protein
MIGLHSDHSEVEHDAFAALLAKKVEPASPSATPVQKTPRLDRACTIVQVFHPGPGNHLESAGLSRPLPFDAWENLQFDLPAGVSGSIRLDPADCPCLLEINSIHLLDANRETPIFSAHTPAALKALQTFSTAIFLPLDDSCLILSYGPDPQILLPEVHHASPLRLVVNIRAHSDFKAASQALAPAAIVSHSAQAKVIAGYENGSEEASAATARLRIGAWSTLVFDLAPGSLRSPIRFRPVDIPCLVEIAEFHIYDAASGNMLIGLRGVADLKRFVINDSAVCLPGGDRYLLFCFRADSHLQVSPDVDFVGAVRIQVTMKLHKEMEEVARFLRFPPDDAADVEILRSELRSSHASRLLLAAELTRCGTEKNALVREQEEIMNTYRERVKRLEEMLEIANSRASVTAQLRAEENEKRTAAALKSMEESLSWRVTKPLRAVMRVIRGSRSA